MSGSGFAQASRSPQDSTNSNVDYPSAKREIKAFEAVLNEVIGKTFAAPFAVRQEAKGAYLQGYGFTFNFLVNIHVAFSQTPFGYQRTGVEITPEQKKRSIEELKDKLIRTLVQSGDGFRHLPPNEWVTVIAFFQDRNFPDEEHQNKTVVLSASKKDLDEFARRDERWRELKQRMKIVEY